MSNPSADDEAPFDPAAARIVAKVRWLMLISGATTLVAIAEDRIAVTLDVGGAIEIRTFDAKTLKPAGRLKFATEP